MEVYRDLDGKIKLLGKADWCIEQGGKWETIRNKHMCVVKNDLLIYEEKKKLKERELEKEEGKWVTLENGQHIFIGEGETLDTALDRAEPSKDIKFMTIDPNLKTPKEDVKQVKEYFKLLPKEDTKDIDQVTIVSNLGSNKGGVVAGKYTRFAFSETEMRSNIMYSEQGLADEYNAKTIVFHEVGHNVVEHMPVEKWDSWEKVWDNNQEGLPSDYSRTNANEGFAECYTYFQQSPVNLGSVKDPEAKPIIEWFYKNVERKK